MVRIIAHLDMDAFFAAVEERDRPELMGLPIVVGANPRAGAGRGVVSTANYKARGYVEHMVIQGKVPERDRIYLRKKFDI